MRKNHKKIQKLKKFKAPFCNICSFPASIELESDGACGDPECCGGGPSYQVIIYCTNKKCDNYEEIY